MESTPKEEEKSHINPIDVVAKAFEELNIDYKSEAFKVEEAIATLREMTESPETTSFKRQEYKLVMTIISEHKFWDKERVVNPLQKVEKEGIIQKIDAKEYQNSKPSALPEGFAWADIDPENQE